MEKLRETKPLALLHRKKMWMHEMRKSFSNTKTMPWANKEGVRQLAPGAGAAAREVGEVTDNL